jgi:N6-adenosine-specific RNA methylase IME4
LNRYRTIVADPPWPIRWSGGGAWRTNGRGERHLNKRFKKALDYPTMPVTEIAALNVVELAESDSHLYLWCPDRYALEGAAAQVARAWGFEPCRFIVWEKTGFGLGVFPRAAHELVLVCKRGRLPYQIRNAGSVQRWGLVYENGARKHSAKPEGFFDLIERASPGPYLELFARRQRPGWDSWGNECECSVEIAS